jgi:hypothetical protein
VEEEGWGGHGTKTGRSALEEDKGLYTRNSEEGAPFEPIGEFGWNFILW